MKADPKVSEGARLERRAFRNYLRRLRKVEGDSLVQAVLGDILRWVQGRQKRYDKRPGGLGKAGSRKKETHALPSN